MRNYLFLIFSFMYSSMMFSQKNETKTESIFSIQFIKSDDGISMKCNDGCAWEQLSFTLGKGQSQSVDYWGMANGELSKIQNDKENSFIFRIKKKRF